MGRWVTAGENDSFCSIAVAAGFVNCRSLREHALNQDLLGRRLRTGDRVYVPEVKKHAEACKANKTHTFVARNEPFPEIRFVRALPDNKPEDDPELEYLGISNFRTDRAGISGASAFVSHNHCLFDNDAFLDPDSFQIEVYDASSTRKRTEILLEAMHPKYAETNGEKTADGFDANRTGSENSDGRFLKVRAVEISPSSGRRFRTPYLRLVTDEYDRNSRPRQTILVTDGYPDENGLEILDQYVRATYVLEQCPFEDEEKCRIRTVAQVGNPELKKRLKLTAGIFRSRFGDAVGCGGITEEQTEKYIYHWLRRILAQADIAPMIVAPGVRLLDPPPRNMLTVSDRHGNQAAGIQRDTGSSPSHMRFRLTALHKDRETVDKEISLVLAPWKTGDLRPTPEIIAEKLAALINDDRFSAAVFVNPPARNRPVNRVSADIIVRDKKGGTVKISDLRCDDKDATLTMAIPHINRVADSIHPEDEFGHRDERLIMRQYDSGIDRIDCYVIGGFQDTDQCGRAFKPCLRMDEAYRPSEPFTSTCMVTPAAVNGTESRLTVFARQVARIIVDAFADTGRHELLNAMDTGGASGTAVDLRGRKRISDIPVKINCRNYSPGPAPTVPDVYEPVARIHELAGKKLAALYEKWQKEEKK